MLLTAQRRVAVILIVLLLSWTELYVFISGDLFASSDFANYLNRYEHGTTDLVWRQESLFYRSGSIFGSLVGYLNYHLIVIHVSLFLYFGLVWRVRSDAVFLVAALFPATFIGFDIFFSAARSTLAMVLFIYMYRFIPSVIILYLIHFGTFLQSLLSLFLTRKRLLVLLFFVAIAFLLVSEQVFTLYELYYTKFEKYEGEGALEGVYNLIYIGFFVVNWIAFDSSEKMLKRFCAVLFLVYLAAAVVSLPYAYRLSYFPILLQQSILQGFRFGLKEYAGYIIILSSYLILVVVRIT